MVQTRATMKRIESGQAPSNDEVSPQVPITRSALERLELDTGPPPAKKRRQANRRHEKGPGKPCQLNLDVLFLIAAYAHPMDLLNLARTCKSLREILMNRSSAFVWKSARRQAPGLPDCPADLSEPEYANLAFYAHCHGCETSVQTVLWKMRRRYCPGCKNDRLCSLSSCHKIIRTYAVLAMERETVRDTESLVDREQIDSFMEEYNHSSDKKQFLSTKRAQYLAIQQHASQCKKWEYSLELERKAALELSLKQRSDSVFARLKERGYEREITCFGQYTIRETHPSIFKTPRPLTDREWARMWPKWLETMNNFRRRRLEERVYPERQMSLETEFTNYVTRPQPNTPTFDLLPHVIDIARFSPFREIIMAPEETHMGGNLFESAFAELPLLVDGWRKEFEVELAKLIKIPSDLSPKDVSSGRLVASGSTKRGREPFQASTDKLHLACAVFDTCSAFVYPEVLHSMYPQIDLKSWHGNTASNSEHIERRFKIRFLSDAPYIVYACGLDPNVATAEDMDRRNARFKCLSCRCRLIWRWRDAMQHAARYHHEWQLSHDGAFRWQLIGDEHMDAIQAAESSVENETSYTRCLLCRPCVGDANDHERTARHLHHRHKIRNDDIKEGVHYVILKTLDTYHTVEMVEKGGRVTFKKPDHFYCPYR